MDPITIALGLAQFAPMIAGWLGGDKAKDVASKVVNVAETVTGQKGDAALAAIQADPNLALQFQTEVLKQHTELAQLALQQEKQTLDAANAQTQQVNETMRVEDQTRVFSWRDFWGYVSGVGFGVVVLLVCYLAGNAVYLNKYDLLDKIPSVVGAFSVLFGIAATVLGVQSSIQTHHEGMAARAAAGTDKGV